METTLHSLPPRKPLVLRSLHGLGRLILWTDRQLQRPRLRKLAIGTMILITLLVGSLALAYPWYELVPNRSDSLPGKLFLLDKTRAPHCGDTTAFDMPETARFYRGHRLIKILQGCPGDRVVVRGHDVLLNGQPVGSWQEYSTQGHHKLFPIEGGVIPAGKVYLYATHPKSYDSRYRSFGLRDRSELLGTATRIF